MREQARLTAKDAAEQLEVSPQKLWRIETGRGHERIRSLDVENMCRLYAASEELTEALVALAKETKASGWWQSYGDVIPAWFELYVGLEAAASKIRKYDPELVPGLLQTRAYAEAVYRVHQPHMDESDLEQAVAVRMERQALLARSFPAPPQYDLALSEAVLRRPITDREAMKFQLRTLLAASEAPHISIRVLPLAVGPHCASVAGGFVILDFPPNSSGGPSEPTTIYSESLTGALYLDRPSEVAAYEEVWSGLSRICLDERQSQKMISKIIGEM